SHYLVDDNGTVVYRLVDESLAAWHAGESFWNGINGLNSSSVGIEIQNRGDLDNPLPDYPASQIAAVIELCQQMIKRPGIRAFNVVAHSDIAPGRKNGPGIKFPWQQLYAAGIGTWPSPTAADYAASKDWTDVMMLTKLHLYGYSPKASLPVLI